jgi:hypothetical protein
MFCDITPCSPLKVKGSFWKNTLPSSACCLIPAGFFFDFFFDPEDGDIFSETSIDFQHTIRCYIPQGRIFYNHRSDNLRSYINLPVLSLRGLKRNKESESLVLYFVEDYSMEYFICVTHNGRSPLEILWMAPYVYVLYVNKKFRE